MTGKILIVDDLATSRIVLKSRLGHAFYGILQAASGNAGLALARTEAPDLVLLDASLPDMDAAEFCRRLRADPATLRLPVVVLGRAEAPRKRFETLSAGADEYLVRPVTDALLLARLRSLIRSREAEAELQARDETCRDLGFCEAPSDDLDRPARIGLVSEVRGEGVIWRGALAAHMQGRIELKCRADVLVERPGTQAPDAYLLVATAGGVAEVLDLMAELRSRAKTRLSAILVALPSGSAADAAMTLDLGAGDVVTGPLSPPEIALRMQRLIAGKRRLEQLRATVNRGLQLAMTDPLTGLYNRRYALPHLARIAERSRSSAKRFAVLVLDLDRFKRINDTWGHAAGDAVLVAVAERLSQNLRAGDLLARIGGEEFLVALPDADLCIARQLAERLCRLVGAEPVTLPNGAEVRVTLSIGLAIGDPSGQDGVETMALLDRADHALLASKAEGRNQVTVDRPAA